MLGLNSILFVGLHAVMEILTGFGYKFSLGLVA
jgi:hypothetical protein